MSGKIEETRRVRPASFQLFAQSRKRLPHFLLGCVHDNFYVEVLHGQSRSDQARIVLRIIKRPARGLVLCIADHQRIARFTPGTRHKEHRSQDRDPEPYKHEAPPNEFHQKQLLTIWQVAILCVFQTDRPNDSLNRRNVSVCLP